MSTLYDINQELLELAEIEDELDEDTLRDTWEALALERAEKIENVCGFIKHLFFMAEGCKAEAKTLLERSKAYDKKAETIKAYLKGQLEPREKYESKRHKITWRKSESVEIDVEAHLLPECYQRTKVTVEADKKALLTDIKCGADIPNVRRIEKLNMGIK
jgi:hypothetical protein